MRAVGSTPEGLPWERHRPPAPPPKSSRWRTSDHEGGASLNHHGGAPGSTRRGAPQMHGLLPASPTSPTPSLRARGARRMWLQAFAVNGGAGGGLPPTSARRGRASARRSEVRQAVCFGSLSLFVPVRSSHVAIWCVCGLAGPSAAVCALCACLRARARGVPMRACVGRKQLGRALRVMYRCAVWRALVVGGARPPHVLLDSCVPRPP